MPMAVYLRHVDGSNHLLLEIQSAQARIYQKVNGVSTNLDLTDAASEVDTTYQVYVRCDEGEVTVMRRIHNDGQAFEEILSTSSCTLASTSALRFAIPENQRATLDNVRLVAGTGFSHPTSVTSYAYNAANELTTMTSDSSTAGWNTTFVYDCCCGCNSLSDGSTDPSHDWGRTISKNTAGHSACHKYRFGSRLKDVATDWPDEQSKSYMYDGLGKRRIEMVTGAQEMTWFRYGLGWKPLSVHEGDASAFWTLGARTVSAVSLGHTVLAMTLGTNPADPLGTLDFITDHLGSGRGVLYGTGLVYEAEYTPYGDLYWDNGSPFGIGYTGHLYDADTQLYYAPYRWYSPQTARWTTRDPLGMVDGPNAYGYVRGQPSARADLEGLFTVTGCCGGNQSQVENEVKAACSLISQKISKKCPSLASCLERRCKDGKVRCKSCTNPDLYGTGYVFTHTARVCTNNVPAGMLGEVTIHEWAHTCGWLHLDQFHKRECGVPCETGTCNGDEGW